MHIYAHCWFCLISLSFHYQSDNVIKDTNKNTLGLLEQDFSIARCPSRHQMNSIKAHTHTHTHTLHFYCHFPGEPGLTSCLLNSPSPFFPKLHILSGQAKARRAKFCIGISSHWKSYWLCLSWYEFICGHLCTTTI